MIRRVSKILLAGVLGLALALVSSPAPAQERTLIDLPTAIKKALEVSPEVREARAKVLFAQAQRDEALGNRWLQVQVNTIFSAVPRARGDQIYSPDTSTSLSGLGPFLRTDLLGIQPLETFGKLTEYIKAARKGIEVEEAGLELKADEVILKVKEIYYGLQLALDSQELVGEAHGLVQEALEKIEKRLKLEDSSATQMDLYKLQSALGMVEGLKSEADKGVSLAQAALYTVCGLDDPAPFPAQKHLEQVEMKLDDLVAYQDSASAKRPEMKQLKAGLEALDSLVNAARAARYPTIYLAGFFRAATAPNRTDIKNPFIDDDFNTVTGGAALGLMWELNFGIHKAKIEQAKAEQLKLKAKEAFAQMYLPLEVTQAYLEVKAAQEQIEATRKSYKAARRWFLAASSNFDLGLVESKEVNDAVLQYANQRAEYFKAIHKHNLGWAKLLKVAGLTEKENQQ